MNAALDAYWSAWSDLAADPTNSAAKSMVRETGNTVANTLNRFASQLDQVDQNNRERMNVDVGQVNELTKEIAELNNQIVSAESGGQSANDLRDERGRALDQLANLVGGQVVEHQNGSVAVYAGGRMLVDGTTVHTLEVQDGQPPTIGFGGGAPPIIGMGGSLGAEIVVSSTTIPNVMARARFAGEGIGPERQRDSLGRHGVHGNAAGRVGGRKFLRCHDAAAVGYRSAVDGARDSSRSDADVGDGGLGRRWRDWSRQQQRRAGDGRAARREPSDLRRRAVRRCRPRVSETSITRLWVIVATATQHAEDEATVQHTLASNADTRRQSVSGVSTDEELIKVIEAQHAYQGAARLVSVVDEMMQTLVDLGSVDAPDARHPRA